MLNRHPVLLYEMLKDKPAETLVIIDEIPDFDIDRAASTSFLFL